MNESLHIKTAIIGAGTIGVIIAAYLAKRGMVEDVFLLEENGGPGQGENAYSAAMIMSNTHTSDPTLIKLTAAAKREYDHFEEMFGFNPEIQRCGSLLISVTSDGADRMRQQVAVQNENGIDSIFLSPTDIQKQFPYLRGEDIQAGIWCRDDGYIDQMRLTAKLRAYAESKGINMSFNTRVTGVEKNPKGILINTEKQGSLTSEKVTIAAGGHSPELTNQLGHDLPLTYSSRTLCTGVRSNQSTSIIEFVDGPDEGFYIRPMEGGGIMVAVGPTQDSNRDPGKGIPSFGKELAGDFLARRFPEFEVAEGGLIGNPGTRSMVRDGLAYFGPLGIDKNINVAFGLSGYGITLAPFFGKEGANLLVEGGIDKEFQSVLSPERFRRSRTFEGL